MSFNKKFRKHGCKFLDPDRLQCKDRLIKMYPGEPSDMGSLFGKAYPKTNEIWVRKGLPKDIRDHVIMHEVDHCMYGQGEFPTNVRMAVRDPKGWMKTGVATVRDKDRRSMYIDKILCSISGFQKN